MSPLLRRIMEPVVDMLSTALLILAIAGMAALLSLLGCAGSTRTIEVTPIVVPPPQCIVAMGPPPPAPPIFREWTQTCRDWDGRQLPADALCLSTAEADELARFAAQSTTYALTVWHACSESTEPNVRVMD